jgi:hypothetical protein
MITVLLHRARWEQDCSDRFLGMGEAPGDPDEWFDWELCKERDGPLPLGRLRPVVVH